MASPLRDYLDFLYGPPDLDDSIPEEPDWLDGRRKLKVCDAPIPPTEDYLSIDDARTFVIGRIADYVNTPAPPEVLVVKAHPGLGKTHFAVRQAEALALAGKNVLYCGPRHDFYLDVLAIAEHPDLWFEWLPRQELDEPKNKPQTCLYVGPINQWMRRGYKGMTFCSSICGWPYINNDCVFHGQKKQAIGKIVFGQHAHITLGHPLRFDAVVIDECPMAAFLHPWSIPAGFVVPAAMDKCEQLTSIMTELALLATADKPFEGHELMDALGGPQRVKDAVDSFSAPALAKLVEPEIHTPEDVEKQPYGHIFALASLLLRESEAYLAGNEYPHRILLEPTKLGASTLHLVLLLRRRVNDAMPAHVICLDATANERLYQMIFRRPIMTVSPLVENRGRVYQVYERSNGKATIQAINQDTRPKMLENLIAQVDHIASKYARVAIITHMQIADRMPVGAEVGHYFAERGTNRFSDADAIIVAGTPCPPHTEIERIAAMILWDRQTPFRNPATNKLPWQTRDTPYNFTAPDGKGRAWPTGGFWSELDLQPILWQYREAEIIQAAHRARIMQRYADVWLLTNIPIDELAPTRLMTVGDIFDAPKGIHPYEWPKLVKIAERAYLQGKPLYTSDLVSEMSISRVTACRYLDLLVETLPTLWQWPSDLCIVPVRGAGQPARAIVPVDHE